ncbi:MAG: holo-ACP synthase [Acidimicrobiales bacterium]
MDLVDLERLAAVLSRSPRLAERVFTGQERQYCAGYADPLPHLGARFAAKEAAMKALGVGLFACGFHEVEVVRRSGAPTLALSGRAEALAARLGLAGLAVSLSHTGKLAIAVVQGVPDRLQR